MPEFIICFKLDIPAPNLSDLPVTFLRRDKSPS